MNLTPTQKADELIEKFRPFAHSNHNHDTPLFGLILNQNATRCAIIAVDEILIMRWNLPHYGNKEGMIFWQEVKTILTDRL